MNNERLHNEADNLMYVRSQGDNIFIICNDMEQVDSVQRKMYKRGNLMIDFEEWDEDKDKKYIITFKVRDGQKPIYN